MAEPISPNLPEAVESLVRKWGEAQPFLTRIPRQVYMPVLQIDLDRARRGQYPLTRDDSMKAMRAILSGEAQTEPPEKSFASRFLSDIGQVIRSVPHLPRLLVEEVQALDEIPRYLSAAESPGDVFKAPGLRMLPGAFLAAEGISGAVEHPGFALLDVAPYTKPVAKAGLSAIGAERLAAVTSPLSRTLDKFGIGPETRATSRVVQQEQRQLHALVKENQSEIVKIAETLTPDERLMLSHTIERGAPEDFAGLPVHLQQAVDGVTKANESLFQKGKELGLLDMFRDEIYPADVAKRLRALEERLGTKQFNESFDNLKGQVAPLQEYLDVARQFTADLTPDQILRITDEMVDDLLHGDLSKASTRNFYLARRAALERVGVLDTSAHKWLSKMERANRGKGPNITDETLQGAERVKQMVAAYTSELHAFRPPRMGDAALALHFGEIMSLQERLDARLMELADQVQGIAPDDWARIQEGQPAKSPIGKEYVKASRLSRKFLVGPESYVTKARQYFLKGRLERAAQTLDRAAKQLVKNPDPMAQEARSVLSANSTALLRESVVRPVQKKLTQTEGRLARVESRIETTEAKLQKAEQTLQREVERNVPARFLPELNARVKEAVEVLARERNPELVGKAWEQIERYVAAGWFDLVPNLTRKDIFGLWKETAPTWLALKEAGFDPVFMHSVDIAQAGRTRWPTLHPEKISTPTAVRRRTWNLKPSIKDFTVALNHQTMEFLERQMTTQVVDNLTKTYGKTRAELLPEYLNAVGKYRTHRAVPDEAVAEELMNREWTQWEPETMLPWRKARGAQAAPDLPGTEAVFIPRHVARVLKEMFPTDKSMMRQAWDTTMSAYRIGILPFSPRFYVYNVLGGAVLTFGRTGPSAMSFLKDAWRMAKSGELPEGVSRGLVSVPENVRTWEAESGRAMARLMQRAISEKATGVGQKFASAVDWLYSQNELIDSMYRSVAYLYGTDRAVTRGLTREAAEREGIKLANKVLQDWDGMVPLERQVIRSLFPFYGWMKHIVSYAFTYPWDHPLRASVVAAFARNEMGDWETGLPTDFQNFLTLGETDALGRVQAINLRGANPFSDVANYFTWAGFLSQLNPLLQGMLEASGVNILQGGPDLFPELTYDPESGRLTAIRQNPVQVTLRGFLPQIEALANWTGVAPSEHYKVLAATDPEAAQRMVLTGLGIPFVPREYWKSKEIARAEVSRQENIDNVLRRALKTGDYDELKRYPDLAPLVPLLERGIPQMPQFHTPTPDEFSVDRLRGLYE